MMHGPLNTKFTESYYREYKKIIHDAMTLEHKRAFRIYFAAEA
jgi:hypothetical protein